MTRLSEMSDGDWAFAEQQRWMAEGLEEHERDDLLPYFGPDEGDE